MERKKKRNWFANFSFQHCRIIEKKKIARSKKKEKRKEFTFYTKPVSYLNYDNGFATGYELPALYTERYYSGQEPKPRCYLSALL